MKRTTKIAIGISTALSLGLAAAVVNAHPEGYGAGSGMGPMGGMGYGQGMGRMGGAGFGPMGHGAGPQAYGNPGAAVENRLAALKSDLNITSAQETAWQAYANKAKQQAETMQTLMTSMQGSTQASAPERLALRTEMMKNRQEGMEGIASSFKDLYAALTPEQKAIADQRVGGLGPMAGQGFRRGPGGGLR